VIWPLALPCASVRPGEVLTIDINAELDPSPRAATGRYLVLRAETVDQRAAYFLSTDRMIAGLSSFFGGLALLLASIGLYGLMSYAVARRNAEIGLRMADFGPNGSLNISISPWVRDIEVVKEHS
jgi:hypothetical protein